MDFYPDLVVISGQEYNAQRSTSAGIILLPYKYEPKVKEGDVISHKTDAADVSLKVLEASFRRIGTFTSANKTPHMLTMKVEVTEEAPSELQPVAAFEADSVEEADEDLPPVTISLHQFIERVSMGNDGEAKEIVKKLLQTNVVTRLLGPGTKTLAKLL